MDAPQENKVQRDDLLGRIAQVSLQIRQAVCEAIPASPDQFLTLVVPGKTVDLTVGGLCAPSLLFAEHSHLSPLGTR